MKRLWSILICLCLLLGSALPVFAEETAEETKHVLVIKTAEDFLAFAENCRLDSYSMGLTVSLEGDLDLKDVDFEDIPIFCGTFEGNGHTITRMNLSGEGSVRGMFRYLTREAVVRNLTVQGNVRPTGSRSTVGGIAGSNAGRIENCQFTGTASALQTVGGIAGINAVSGIIQDCKAGGVISGTHFAGGITGENLGVVRNCQNLAVVNSTAQQNEVSLPDITLDSLMNAEAANTVTDIGGIAGSSTGVIKGCTNRGAVGYQHMGYNIGGIAGSQSGYIENCENYGQILGRKEVGGIVGQMEPAARIEYDEDALQVLEGQLAALSGTVDSAAANVRVGSQQMKNQICDLQDSMDTAEDALETLIPDPDNPLPPDADSLQAAQNALSSAMTDMNTALWGIGETTDSMMGALSNDLYRMQDQLYAMRTTLSNVSDTVGGSLLDVSDADTLEELTGKVEGCSNHGDVLADINAGGIAGAMALENDLDPEDDWRIEGNHSLNFESELRAVILDCENRGQVTVRRQSAGGIVGWQSMGLVKRCRNSGSLDASGATGVGGITGTGTGYIRENAARCRISGSKSVGGIAGSATVVTDCYSLVQLEDVQESYGAVIGKLEDPQKQMEAPVSGNRYLAPGKDAGGIDGISYDGIAQAEKLEFFMEEESLPEMFRKVSVVFRDDLGRETRFHLASGDGLAAGDIPAVPRQEGRDGIWEGLEEADLTQVYFDMHFQAVYTDEATVIQSADVTESGKPVMLLAGSFSAGTEAELTKPEILPDLQEGQALLDHWQYRLVGEGSVSSVRLCLPEEADRDHLKALILDENGQWNPAEFALSGSYMVIPTEATELTVAIVQEPGMNLLLVCCAGGAMLVLAGFALWRKNRRGK